MFFCDSCRTKRQWPESLSKSYGKCETCGEKAVCNDVPSTYLPPPPKPKPAPIVLVKPKCTYGYPIEQLTELLTDTQLGKFLSWHRGQTYSVCNGWIYDSRRGFNVTSGCGPHGAVYYEHDVKRWAEGKSVID